ncbi:MAG: zinc ABC transporter substrate-binding protein, partial [Planctomycetes bacterium]|nr:zinc ABC transporter substrate-binding protein [Planctomycetota bacterium]
MLSSRSTCFRIVAAVVLIVHAGCGSPRGKTGSSAEPDPAARPVVYVVNYPLKYFAERIGGDGIDVVFPVPVGEDPAYWNPDDQTIAGYQGADLILLNGATYAKWTAHVSLPPSRIVNTSQGFENEYIQLEDQVVHRHGPGGEHAHEGYAFTTWLDPRLALQQAATIQRVFSERWPDRADAF